jgi:predicted ester cyclase
MAAERNKARVTELMQRVLNEHDLSALEEFTSNPMVVGSATALLQAFPDLRVTVRWMVAEGDIVVVFHDVVGTQRGPWLFVQEATGQTIETSFVLAFQFDEAGMISDQWLGSNFIEMFAQLGWGLAPVGEIVPDRAST